MGMHTSGGTGSQGGRIAETDTDNGASAMTKEQKQVLDYLRGYEARIKAAPERSSLDLIIRAGMIGAEKAMKIAIEAIENGEHITLNQ